MDASTAGRARWLISGTVAAVLLCGGAVGSEDGYIARRGVARVAEAPAARIGRIPTVEEVAEVARSSSASDDLAIVHGLTPAGGLTIELDGRFTTQVRVGSGSPRAQSRDDGGQCSVLLRSTP